MTKRFKDFNLEYLLESVLEVSPEFKKIISGIKTSSGLERYIIDWVDMFDLCFRESTAQLITEFSSSFDFNQPYVTYDISSALFTIHSDKSMDFTGSAGDFD